MGTKKYKPTTAGQRTRQILDYAEITTTKPEKSLITSISKKAGRNNMGRITVRHRGGGNKRQYRNIDFKRNKDNVPATVKTVEYDPNRSAFIALIQYTDGDKRYVIAPANIKAGTVLHSGESADIKPGNTLPLYAIPTGTNVFNVELAQNKGGQLARSAGAYAVVLAKNEQYATIKLPSGEVRLINVKCRATIGEVGNSDHRNTRQGKAGINRKKGRRPRVRGSVMNPCDHPHGGGEGRAPIGRSAPMTPWGKPALGYKTRRKEHKYRIKARK